jgi:mannosyltransferase
MLSTVSSPQIKSAILLDTKDASWLRELAVLAPIVLVYLILAFYRIDHQSLWVDELASIQSAAPNESFFTRTLWVTGHGPLYFALLHLWLKAGQTEFAIRSLSAFLGMAAVCLMYATGLRLFNRKVAVISALLLATSPFFIWYSQEARYITLAIFTSLLSMYSFHQVLSTGSFKSWLIYALATIVALLSFVTNIFVVFAQGLYVLSSKHWRPNLRKWLAWQVLVAIIFGTWLLISYGRLSIISAPGDSSIDVELDPMPLETGTPRELSAAVIPYTFFAFSTGFSMGPSIRELHLSRELLTLMEHLPTILPLLFFFGAVFAFGTVQLRSASNVPGLVLLWLLIPISMVLIVAATTNVAYNVRYACAALPAYIFILAAAIANFRRRVVQRTALMAVLFVNGVALAQHYFNPWYAREDARAAAQYLQAAARPRDIIVAVGNTTAFRYYYKGSLPIVHWDNGRSDRAIIAANLQGLAINHDRLWLLQIRPWEGDPKRNVKSTLDQMVQITHANGFPGVDIFSYALKK